MRQMSATRNGTSHSTDVALPEGGTTVIIKCRDLAGNVSAPLVFTVHAGYKPSNALYDSGGRYGPEDSSVSSSRLITLWNGNLGMVNRIELGNNSQHEKSVTVALLDQTGTEKHRKQFKIPARTVVTEIVNSWPGFDTQSYGKIKIFGSNLNEYFRGRMTFLRREDSPESGQEAAFVFSVEASAGYYGTSYVSYNTYDPSRTAAQELLPFNWLSVDNYSDTEELRVRVHRLDQNGKTLKTQTLRIPPNGRRDIDAGLEDGRNRVGMNVVESLNDVPHRVYSIRYGLNVSPGSKLNDYRFAFPLPALVPKSNVLRYESSRGAGAENWLEVTNTCNEKESGTLTVSGSTGNGAERIHRISLNPGAQVHVNLSSSLEEIGSISGIATLEAGAGRRCFVAQSAFYYHSGDGRLQAMYAVQPIAEVSGTVQGYWDRATEKSFNWLRLFNTSGVEQLVVVRTYDSSGVLKKKQNIRLAGMAGADVETGTPEHSVGDTGLFTVTGNEVTIGHLRIDYDDFGVTDFAYPVQVQ